MQIIYSEMHVCISSNQCIEHVDLWAKKFKEPFVRGINLPV